MHCQRKFSLTADDFEGLHTKSKTYFIYESKKAFNLKCHNAFLINFGKYLRKASVGVSFLTELQVLVQS